MVVINILIPLLISVVTLVGTNARLSLPPILLQNNHRYTTPNTISHSPNKYSRYYTTKTTSNSIIQHNSILQIRGGGIFNSKSDKEEYEYEYYEVDDNTSNSDDSEYYYEEEDTDYLLSTPLSSSNTAIKDRDDSTFSAKKKQQAASEQKRLQKEEKKRKLIEKKRLAAAEQAKHKRDIKAKARQNSKKNSENEYLLETPATETKPRKKSQSKRRSIKRRSQWLPQSSSKTSSALVPSGGITNRRSISSIKSYNYSAILSSLSGILSTVIQPIKNVLSSITNKLTSLISNYISVLWSIIINTFDYLWYGPINGVTTTGIVNRHGGLQSLLFNTQIGMTISYIVGLTLLSVLVTKLWNIKPIGDSDNDSDEDDDDDAYYVDPPTVEEELRFLHHDFDARNPLAKERIAKVITKKQNRFSLPERQRQRRDIKKDDSPRNRKGRRKHAIESIQSWWKERPGQRSISIIEPQHLRDPQQQSSKTQSQESMRRLQNQLMASEQEREIMSRDIRDLKHDLQKAHDDSRSIVSQNKWLEKQTSQFIEAEQARASVKGVLDRERTRRFAENERKNQLGRGYNDLDLDKTRKGTRIADYSTLR